MPKIIGIQPVNFQTKEGETVTGKTIFTSEPILPKNGIGEKGEKFFLSSAKLALLDFDLQVGDMITILYNKYGKVANVIRDDDIEIS